MRENLTFWYKFSLTCGLDFVRGIGTVSVDKLGCLMRYGDVKRLDVDEWHLGMNDDHDDNDNDDDADHDVDDYATDDDDDDSAEKWWWC